MCVSRCDSQGFPFKQQSVSRLAGNTWRFFMFVRLKGKKRGGREEGKGGEREGEGEEGEGEGGGERGRWGGGREGGKVGYGVTDT